MAQPQVVTPETRENSKEISELDLASILVFVCLIGVHTYEPAAFCHASVGAMLV